MNTTPSFSFLSASSYPSLNPRGAGLRAALFGACVMLGACGQTDPPGNDTSGESGDSTTGTDGTELNSYYPLVDGATWTYVQRTAAGQVTGTEVVNTSAGTWNGAEVMVFTDNPNAAGEWTVSYIGRIGTAAMRVHKELLTDAGPFTLVDYDPGFMRADDGWTEVGALGEETYLRTESDGTGQNPVVEMRGHTFTVNALSESVTVPAGTYDCISVTRTRTTGMSAGEIVHFWYAAGVGKVREERPAEDKIEELISFSIPGGQSGS